MKSLTKIVLAVFMLGVVSSACYAADMVTKTTTTVTTARTNAPIYTGPVQEIELLELTLADFEYLANNNPAEASTQYVEYQNQLKNPKPNPDLVLYKMKITDRDLTLANFQGVNVSPELAQARYQEYLRLNPTPVDGRSVRYAYVYHTPVAKTA